MFSSVYHSCVLQEVFSLFSHVLNFLKIHFTSSDKPLKFSI